MVIECPNAYLSLALCKLHKSNQYLKMCESYNFYQLLYNSFPSTFFYLSININHIIKIK